MQLILFYFYLFILMIHESMQYANEPICYSQLCPQETTSCKKNIRSSVNRRHLEIRINCLDDYAHSLKEYFFEEVNRLNPHVHYESSSYSALGSTYDNSNNRYYRYPEDNGLENFV